MQQSKVVFKKWFLAKNLPFFHNIDIYFFKQTTAEKSFHDFIDPTSFQTIRLSVVKDIGSRCRLI